METPCYNYNEINFEKGFLDDSVDATYILHLEGNGRLSNIYEQLQTFHPTKKVMRVFIPKNVEDKFWTLIKIPFMIGMFIRICILPNICFINHFVINCFQILKIKKIGYISFYLLKYLMDF